MTEIRTLPFWPPASPNEPAAGRPDQSGLQPTPVVVALAATPRDIEAAKRFVQAMEGTPGLSLVLLLQYREALDEKALLGDLSAIWKGPVSAVSQDQPLEEGAVYTVSPNVTITLRGGRLLVQPAPERAGERGTIDTFLVSLAEEEGKRAIGITFAGLQSGGTLGLIAIKEHGGLTLAEQAEEIDSAGLASPAYPTNLSALADLWLPVEAMVERVRLEVRTLARAQIAQDFDMQVAEAAPALSRIASILLNRTGHDFHGYKHNTFLRRVQRRMQVAQMDTVEAYVDYLRETPDEPGLLFNDLLIGVTHFFRDPKEFAFVEREIVPKLFEGKTAADQLRVWVLGCATGEEAYSIAMLLREQALRLEAPPQIQIFATDIDSRGLVQGRSARYSASALKEVTPERLARWFVKEGDTYCVVKEIREMCLFSQHNLIKDAPFSRLDMVSCRNLLIYLGQDLQDRVIPLFHFALRPQGYLFLGNSETVSRHAKLFAPVDRRYRVFQPLEVLSRPLPDFPLTASLDAHRATERAAGMRNASGSLALMTKQAERIMERYQPAYMIVDAAHDVLHFSGRTGRFLDPPAGHASLNVFNLIHRDLRVDLRAALMRAEAGKGASRLGGLRVHVEDQAITVTLSVEPVELGPGAPPRFLVVLQDGPAIEPFSPPSEASGEALHVHRLEDELRRTRERLQATVEELSRTNEELKASNEEYQSVNEELQSSNEELETSKEELQSLNEELQTVNGELAHRVEELARANSDLQNLLESTEIAAIFLDASLRIKNYTPAISEIFHLMETDLGRPIHHIANRISYGELEADVAQMLRTLEPVERETRNPQTGAQYLIRVLPYRSIDNLVEGAVLTFMDVTALVRAETRLRDREALLRSIVEGIPQLVWRAVDTGEWTWVSPQWTAFTSQSEAEALGHGWLDKVHADDRERVMAAWKGATEAGQLEVDHRLWNVDEGSYRAVHLRARPVIDETGNIVEWFGTATDVHAMLLLQERQQVLLHELQHRVRNTLAIVRSVARRTAESSNSVEAYADRLEGRINAMARTQTLLTRAASSAVDLGELIRTEIGSQTLDQHKIQLDGPKIPVSGKAAENLSLAIHELTTNSVKHGALSISGGAVDVTWEIDRQTQPEILRLVWSESGLDEPLSQPERRGFGS
ncbi:CheR family methyltransferase [Xaviernesmea oryzae]|uniref:CheR family methyltransferase n=1 Tax=Xaviernesmea oryzae TaxID=464029 RepID=UPI0008D4B382|nr:CheR family methyltransferase [Xaviernesmea oryzae]SEL83562.1 two-component system, chemotaxis family, CheB/CheR fusion protein [Xaviernesmea oryzae]